MFGWHCLQSEVRLTIIFLLLLISSQNASNASKMKHLPQNEAATKQISSKNKVDIHRLYYAYRDRVKEGGDELKLGTGPIAESTAVAEEENEDSLVKSRAPNVSRGVIDKSEKTALIGKEIAENSKDAKKTQLMSSTGNCDAPDEHHMGDVKCVPKPKTKIVENKHKVLEKLKIKEPDLKGMVILKMDSPSKEKVNPSNSLGKSDGNYEALDSAERCIAELNSIYKEFISAWKKPQSDSKKPNLIVVTPVRLNALNELMNVVENLKQPNTMNDFVKAINDEMSRESADITSFDKLNNNIAKANPMKVERATCIFKRMSNDRNVGKISDLKTGGLYEQYKSKLDEILKANHSPNKLNAKDLINSFRNDMPQCHCDAKKHLTLDSEGNKIFNGQSQCHCEASRYALGGDLSKLSNAVVQCHCDDMKNARLVDPKTGKDNDYLEALNGCMKSAKEKSTNGGPKPYYISNSKQRQMVWNDIPLMRSGQTNATQTVVKGIGKAITNSEENRQATVKINNLDAKSEVPIISTLQRNVTNSPTFNKNQKQLQHLLKVLQAKHRSSNTKRSFKRALVDYTERIGNPLGNVGFPQVLVNQVGQVGTGQQAGSGMIDNIAKQLNVSPMEMAQRIAASSNSLAPPSYPWQSNSASQTIGYQCPSPQTTHKITSENPQNQQGATNVASMLEKILSRLQTIQDTNKGVEIGPTDKLPCCFAEPSNGAPCELTGSWESLLLGVRINIADEHKVVKEVPKPVCAQPKTRRSSNNRFWRQCVKLTPKELRDRFKAAGELKELSITIEETVPPRPHEMIENIADWNFTGHAISTLGGPVSFSCRNLNSKLMGTFIGFCRNCGCIDTIFGSWTFCQPSRDCQDITMSIFDRRDVLRRYSLPDIRRERIKEQLYTRSKFAKLEKQSESPLAAT